MAPNALGIALVAATCLFANAAWAQTAAVNPQRPARGVESVVPLRQVKAEAARLDTLLESGLQRRHEVPGEIVDDATFLRRAYLDIVGRIPTLQETEAFFADQDPQKRDLLSDKLLDSQGRTSHFANFWFDLLRVKSRQRQLNGEPFAHFIRESIQQDKPYDQFVRELLTAEGAAHEAGHGATGYLLRDMNMPHDAMANTLRIFLGTRLECAQCHNHPFDTWTQKEFYEMAAFFGGIRYRTDEQMKTLAGTRALLANADDRTKGQARNLLQRMNQGISGTGTGMERLPDDYKYDDAKPQSPILANTIFGAEVKLKYPTETRPAKRAPQGKATRGERAAEANSRAALADWMTNKKNPRFTKMIVNRMWARTFGEGLIEPLDDWKKDTVAVHPELFAQLEKVLVDLDYDLRQFERVLVHMKLFQRATPAEDPGADIPYAFAGPLGHRLSAEQLWDSLLTLVYDDIDERLRPLDARAKEAYEQYAELKTATPEQLVAMVEERRNPGKMSREQMQQQREDARRQLAGDAELQKRAQPLLRELAMARRQGDQKRVAEIAQQLQAVGFNLGQRTARGQEGDLMMRASDLAQPAPANHPLHVFGQSDRDTIDAASTAATVPQVLTMLNGFLDQRVLEGASALKRDLETAPNGERRVRIAFLTILNREPTPDEVKEWRRAIAIDGEAVIRDLVWVLCNCNEFRFAR